MKKLSDSALDREKAKKFFYNMKISRDGKDEAAGYRIKTDSKRIRLYRYRSSKTDPDVKRRFIGSVSRKEGYSALIKKYGSVNPTKNTDSVYYDVDSPIKIRQKPVLKQVVVKIKIYYSRKSAEITEGFSSPYKNNDDFSEAKEEAIESALLDRKLGGSDDPKQKQVSYKRYEIQNIAVREIHS